ncbi:DMT family transporter [Clostridium estertheticum]|uniref:DMT family transporter n=1 Tax=Clostridium estertheticum TaxID=238834 RepID=UPI00287BC649|nr:SMR family transporter [Clostridium estertheticum]
MLTLALNKIEVGTAYAIWSGFGTALISTIGVVFFKEVFNLQKTVCISLIIIGVIGLNLSTAANHL